MGEQPVRRRGRVPGWPDWSGARPSAQALAWASESISPGSQVVAKSQLRGGISSCMHALVVQTPTGARHRLVLRYWVDPEAAAAQVAERNRWRGQSVEREARALTALTKVPVPGPELVAVDPSGASAGTPCLLMTRLTGRILLQPSDRGRWLSQMAVALAAIHDADPERAPDAGSEDWENTGRPDSAEDVGVWETVLGLLAQGPTPYTPRFMHGDYQHFNLLWSRQHLSGVVDWAYSRLGAPDLDVGHCRLNLAVLFSAEVAEQFRLAYEAEAGRKVDPWWDLRALASYNDEWPRFLPLQVGNRAPLDTGGMTGRLEDLLRRVVRRAG